MAILYQRIPLTSAVKGRWGRLTLQVWEEIAQSIHAAVDFSFPAFWAPCFPCLG
jgi:hypothetical protein